MTTPSAPAILIVEDELIIGADIARLMRRLGYTVVGPLASGEAAVASVRAHPPALVLLDIHLAGPMDGIATATMIQDENPVPVICMSAQADAAAVAQMRQAGVCGFITKPFDEVALRAKIELALGSGQGFE